MEKYKITKLVEKYNNGQATDDDLRLIEQLLEAGSINMDDLTALSDIDERIQRFMYRPSSPELDMKFYQMLAQEKKSINRFNFKNWFVLPIFAPGLAVASVTFLLGLVIGYVIFKNPHKENSELQALSREINSMKEMMMLTLLENESATDRIKAVNLTQEMSHASESVTRALISTLNKDENINVRLAALDALQPYMHNNEVRAEIIKSIAKQDSPLVQVALAELMAALQEKSSVPEFKKLLDNERTPEEIKKRIREKIDIII
jgi:hypothetical protein